MQPSSFALLPLTFPLLICLTALGLGGWRERTGAALYLVACLIAIALNGLSHNLALSHVITDSACLIGFVILCWKSPSPWPFWAAGAQLIATMASLYSLLNMLITKGTYLAALILSSSGVLLALLIGTASAVKARHTRLKASE